LPTFSVTPSKPFWTMNGQAKTELKGPHAGGHQGGVPKHHWVANSRFERDRPGAVIHFAALAT
jgi:hypothetical protein